jgi:hypothetical protein
MEFPPNPEISRNWFRTRLPMRVSRWSFHWRFLVAPASRNNPSFKKSLVARMTIQMRPAWIRHFGAPSARHLTNLYG